MLVPEGLENLALCLDTEDNALDRFVSEGLQTHLELKDGRTIKKLK